MLCAAAVAATPAQHAAAPDSAAGLASPGVDTFILSTSQQQPATAPDGGDGEPSAAPPPHSNPNKHFVKQLRACHTVQHVSEALSTAQQSGVALDPQAVAALGSALLCLAQRAPVPAPHLPHSSNASGSSGSATPAAAAPAADSRGKVAEFAARVWAPLLLAGAGEMDAVGFSTCMHVAATLRLHHHLPTLGDSMAQACVASLPGSSPRVQSTVLCALVGLGSTPPAPWLRAWARASMQALRAYTLRDLGAAAAALARVAWAPPEAWTARMLGVLRVQVQALRQRRRREREAGGGRGAGEGGDAAWSGAEEACGQLRSVAQVLWACARLKVLPEPQTLDVTLDLMVDLLRVRRRPA